MWPNPSELDPGFGSGDEGWAEPPDRSDYPVLSFFSFLPSHRHGRHEDAGFRVKGLVKWRLIEV